MASSKAPRSIDSTISQGSSSGKLKGVTIGTQSSSSPAKSISATPSTSSASVSNAQQALLRNRKLSPNSKAKAQASASRALREQLAAALASEGGEAPLPEIVAAEEQRHSTLAESSNMLPIRRLYDAIAYATAESYDFDKLIASGRLPSGWQLLEDGEVIYIPSWPQPSSESSTTTKGEGEAFIFRSGSYVTWGMTVDQSRKFLRMVIKGQRGDINNAEEEGYDEIGDEAMEYLIADDQITRIVGDVIVIGQAPRTEPDEQFENELADDSDSNRTSEDSTDWSPMLARLAFSQGLSRSARLSVQEAALSDYLEEVSTIPGRLELESKVPLHRKEVIRKMGTLLKLRQRANLDSENFLDDPEMYWENWKVESHYDSICLALDIETRFKAYNEKLDHGENLLGILRALLTESSTHRMEL
jgi:uncharacterized Rmd1/YagE family protein